MTYSVNTATSPTAVTSATQSSSGNSGWGVLGTLLSVAATVAIPFVAPAIAGAIFGGSVMAAWGGVGGVLASAGVGAVLGGAVSGVTGGDVVTGALGGALGGGVGALGPVLGAGGALGAALGAGSTAASAAPAAIGGAWTGGWGAAGIPAAVGAAPALAAGGGGLASGLTSAGGAAGTGLSGLGSWLGKMPWDKIGNAALGAAPDLLGSLISDVTPISPDAQATYDAIKAGLKTQEDAYSSAKQAAANLDPNYFAQTAANAARVRTASAANQNIHDLALRGGTTDPARVAAENRRAAVAGTAESGRAFNDAYLTALQAQLGAEQTAAGLRPNYNDYAAALSQYGPDAIKKKRAAEIAASISPWVAPFLKTNTSQQAGTGATG